MRIYRKISEKKKEKILQIIKKFFQKEKFVKECIVFGSFVKRNYFRDIDIGLVGNIDEDVISKFASRLERKLGVEVDIKIFDEMPAPVKFEVLKYGKFLLKNKKFKQYKYEFIKRYIDFVEWWKKWI